MAVQTTAHLNRAATYGLWAWALAGMVLGLVGAALAFAPASWVQRAALLASDGRVVLHDSQGTIWHGSAELGFSGGQGSNDATRLPGRVQWDLGWGWGELRLRLQAGCCTAQPQDITFKPGLRSWQLQFAASESTWPAAMLSGLGTPWNTVQLQGPLVVRTPGLSLGSAVDRMQLEGSLSLDMPALNSSLSTLRPLGSYQLLLQGGEQASLSLHTIEGSLQLQGIGHWTGSHLRFEGEARADASHEAELSNLLNIMGRRNGARSVITLG
jgi:general secretion pathway protein N